MMQYGIKTLFSLFTLSLLAACSSLPVTSKKNTIQTIAFYNVENLYDTQNASPAYDDAYTATGTLQWDEAKYKRKIANLAATIKTIGGSKGPAVLGLAEVENKQVVEDLVNSKELKRNGYSILHLGSPDLQGLGVALLYKPRFFEPTSSRSIKINYTEKGFKSCGILEVQGELLGEPVTIYVNSWPATTRNRRGKINESRIRAAAATLRKHITEQQATDKDANIIVMGDFNAEPKSKVMEQVLQATGRPNPYYRKELFNTFYMSYINGMGSSSNRGNFQMLDQIIVSKSLTDNDGLNYVHGSANIHNPDEIKHLYGKYKNTPRPTFSGTTYFGGHSDHFPVYIKVRKDK